MLVKTAHRDFLRDVLGEIDLERGEWTACSTEINGQKLQACWLHDQDFISTCSMSIPGEPRKTRHHGPVTCPQVAVDY